MMQAEAEGRGPHSRRAWMVTAALLIFEISIFAFAIGAMLAREAKPAYAGWQCRLLQNDWVVNDVDQHGPATDLRAGDQVLSVNGAQPGWLGPAFRLMDFKLGRRYTVTIRRDAETLSIPLRIGQDPSVSVIDVLATLLFALLFYLAGLIIRLGGRNDITARLGDICFFLGGLSMVGPVLLVYPGWGVFSSWWAVAIARIPRPFQMAFGWDFVSRFPHTVPEKLPIKTFRILLYVAAAVLWALFNFPVFAELTHLPVYPALEWLGRDGPFIPIADTAFDGLVSAAGIFILVRNYRLLIDWDSRRRIRLVAAFFGIATISLLLLRSLEIAATVTNSEAFAGVIHTVETVTTVAMGLVPMALAYAVLRHRVLGVRLVIRSGLQYLLAKNVLRVVLSTPALIVLVQIVRDPDRSVLDLLLRSSWHFYVPVMVTAALSLRYRHEVGQWLDRRFFRVAIQEEELLVAITDSIRAATTEEEVASAAEQQIARAFAADGVRIFLRSALAGELESVLWKTTIDAQTLAQLLERQRASARGRNLSLSAPLSMADAIQPAESFPSQGKLLVLPLIGTDGRTFGAFVLGHKKSEQAYTTKERELLRAIGAQVVMACEVLRLKRTVDKESRQRVAVLGRLEREHIQLLQECLKCGYCYDTTQSQCPKDGDTLQLTLPVERLIVGRYRLDRRLGSGGMGCVYEALDTRLEKRVAVKILIGELFGNQHALLRFKREAHAVASLRHPNIVGLHDFGELPAGGAFLVMDLVPGIPWRSHLRGNQPLSPDRVAGWVEGLCEGVAAAHRSGMVHRDLKPENVMIANSAEGETAVILDFGLAKFQPEFEAGSNHGVTVAGMIMGTRPYMSPEQLAGGIVGPPSDVFAIAVMTLETLARFGPPGDGATVEWASRALQRIVKPDSKLIALFASAMLDNPEGRIAPVEEFGRLLVDAIRWEKPLALSITRSDEAETKTLSATEG